MVYKVKIWETSSKEVLIEAKTADEAEEIGNNLVLGDMGFYFDGDEICGAVTVEEDVKSTNGYEIYNNLGRVK